MFFVVEINDQKKPNDTFRDFGLKGQYKLLFFFGFVMKNLNLDLVYRATDATVTPPLQAVPFESGKAIFAHKKKESKM